MHEKKDIKDFSQYIINRLTEAFQDISKEIGAGSLTS